ncbi:MAG TPA: hypothetical protein DCM87_15550 [Planctomycetes bacterium]|nr:hypothetical protein [Planctomycetota bacterium]
MATTLDRHIESTPGTCGGKPRIAGHRIRVQDIAVWHEHLGQTPEEIVTRFPQLTLGDVHAALAYYFDHKDEICRDLREDEEAENALRAKLGSGPLAQRVLGRSEGQ